MRPLVSDPYLTLFARIDCPLCNEARQVLSGSGIDYLLRYVTRKHEGVLWVWDENGKGPIAEATTEQIPAVPALCVRDKDPALIFCSLETIVAFCAGRTFLVNRADNPQPHVSLRV